MGLNGKVEDQGLACLQAKLIETADMDACIEVVSRTLTSHVGVSGLETQLRSWFQLPATAHTPDSKWWFKYLSLPSTWENQTEFLVSARESMAMAGM